MIQARRRSGGGYQRDVAGCAYCTPALCAYGLNKPERHVRPGQVKKLALTSWPMPGMRRFWPWVRFVNPTPQEFPGDSIVQGTSTVSGT